MKILPDEIPDDHAPLNEIELPPLLTKIDPMNEVLKDGQNVFVSLLTGRTYTGGCWWIDENKFTVGQSDPIDRSVVESCRIV